MLNGTAKTESHKEQNETHRYGNENKSLLGTTLKELGPILSSGNLHPADVLVQIEDELQGVP